MAEPYKPLFNRTYLKIILWVVAIAIVLLSASGPDRTEYIAIQQHDTQPAYFVTLDKRDSLEVQLIYRLGAALSGDQQLMHRLLENLVTEQLNSGAANAYLAQLQARVGVQRKEDRLTVQLSIPATALDDHQRMAALPEQLTQLLLAVNLNADLETRWNRLDAKRYLQNQDPEALLLEQFGNILDQPSGVHPLQQFAAFYTRVINTGQLTLALYGPEAKLITQAMASRLPGYQTSIALPQPALTPARQRLNATGNSAYLLSGTELSGRQDGDFAAQQLAVQTLQAALQAQEQFKFRLIWKPLDMRGYLAMMLHGAQLPDSAQRLQPVYDELFARVDDALIERTRHALQTQFAQRMVQQDSQLALLNSIAFYRLPLDYMPRFAERLNTVDNAQVKAQIRAFLDLQQLHFIYLPAL